MSTITEDPTLRVLIIEDNRDIAENIGDYLEMQGHIPDFAYDGISGLHLAVTVEYDVIVLDIMLPAMDGLTFCQKLRQDADIQTPVLILTARDTLQDKLAGFESGADDYLVKPFAIEELSARLRVLARRIDRKPPAVLCVEDIELDTNSMTVKRAGTPIELNRTCLKILACLMRAHPGIVERKQLEYALWGDTLPGSDALRSHIYTLRRKIEHPPFTPILQTIHGVGFRLKSTA